MSGRKLGGGRILGNGKGLAPPPTTPRASSPLAPSDSTVSIGSSSLSPPISGSLPDIGQDIGSSISVGAQPKAGLSSDESLVCPICTEEMVWSILSTQRPSAHSLNCLGYSIATQSTHRRQSPRTTRRGAGRSQDMVRQAGAKGEAFPAALPDQSKASRVGSL